MHGRTRLLRALAVAATAAATVTPLALTGTGAQASVTEDGLVAEYLFAGSGGAEVPNTAAGTPVGAAQIVNGNEDDWTGTALTLRGGAKEGPGNWVRLPDDLLVDATSATITAEVQAAPAMLDTFHFLWNIGNESSATEYFFTSLNCGSGRTPLAGIKSGGDEHLVGASSCTVNAQEWTNVAAVIDGASGASATATLYLDGIEVASADVPYTPADIGDQSLNTVARGPWPDPLFQGSIASFRVYDRALSGEEIAEISADDADRNSGDIRASMAATLAELGLSDLITDTHIDLPTAGGLVTWTSSNPALISDDGTVSAPLPGEPAETVTLSATASRRGIEASESISVTVQPSTEIPDERAERLAGRFVIPPVVASGTPLPAPPPGTALTVESTAGSAVTVVDDQILATSGEEETGELTAILTDASTGRSAVRSFTVTVMPAQTQRLLAYDRVPTTSAEANNADVALSMHLAVSDGETWEPLNENYGIFFPTTARTPDPTGTSSDIVRSLRDPHLFRTADGGFGVLATRVARGGGPDGSQASSVLFARTDDLLSYDEVGLVDLGVSSGVNEPAAVYDTASERYLVTWTSDTGVSMYTTFSDLADESTRSAIERGAVTVPGDDAGGDGVADFASGNLITVAPQIVEPLLIRFGRIENTSRQAVEDIALTQGEELTVEHLPARVQLGYSDGSASSLAVTWDPADIAEVDTSQPGRYEINGQVRHPQYPTPFANERADPSVFSFDHDGEQKFLMIATEDLHMSNIDPPNGAHMPIRIADRIDDLSDEALEAGRTTELDLLSAGDTDAAGEVMTGCFWAPEFHMIGGRLSVLFMPCYDGASGHPDMWTGRASIIQLKQDAQGNHLDPAEPDNWTTPEHVLRADGTALNQLQGISLDMTFFQDSGRSYYLWQQLGALFIAQVDPSEPTRLITEPSRILVPEYAWDNTIAEGGNVHVRDGVLYLIYSGSTVGDTYTTGLATAPAGVGADLSDIQTWSKLNYPIQKSGPFNGSWQLGTGHGMWSNDEDDNLLYVFHARTDTNGLTGRDMFVRRVHWASDGMPVFDMESTEELAAQNEQLNVTVVVAPREDDAGTDGGDATEGQTGADPDETPTGPPDGTAGTGDRTDPAQDAGAEAMPSTGMTAAVLLPFALIVLLVGLAIRSLSVGRAHTRPGTDT